MRRGPSHTTPPPPDPMMEGEIDDLPAEGTVMERVDGMPGYGAPMPQRAPADDGAAPHRLSQEDEGDEALDGSDLLEEDAGSSTDQHALPDAAAGYGEPLPAAAGGYAEPEP
ncbi:MAG TPA: hypothetical protein VGQ83_07580, partial [Polyangia bacterium]